MASSLGRTVADLIEDSVLRGAAEDPSYDGPDDLADAPVQAVVSLSSLGTQAERPVRAVSGEPNTINTSVDGVTSAQFRIGDSDLWTSLYACRVTVVPDQSGGVRLRLSQAVQLEIPTEIQLVEIVTAEEANTGVDHLITGTGPPLGSLQIRANPMGGIPDTVTVSVDGIYVQQEWEPQNRIDPEITIL